MPRSCETNRLSIPSLAITRVQIGASLIREQWSPKPTGVPTATLSLAARRVIWMRRWRRSPRCRAQGRVGRRGWWLRETPPTYIRSGSRVPTAPKPRRSSGPAGVVTPIRRFASIATRDRPNHDFTSRTSASVMASWHMVGSKTAPLATAPKYSVVPVMWELGLPLMAGRISPFTTRTRFGCSGMAKQRAKDWPRAPAVTRRAIVPSATPRWGRGVSIRMVPISTGRGLRGATSSPVSNVIENHR